MSRTLTAPVAALLGALLLVVGLAGGATAAKMITGKQIKNGTVTTADVKDGSLRGSDVRAGSIAADRLAPAARNEVRAQTGDSQDLAPCSDTGLDDCAPLAAATLTAGT